MIKRRHFPLRTARLVCSLTACRKIILCGLLLCLSAIAEAKSFKTPEPNLQRTRLTHPESKLVYPLTPGIRLTYTLAQDTESASDFTPAIPSPHSDSAGSPADTGPVVTSSLAHSFNTSLRAELTLTVLAKTAEGFIVGYELNDPTVTLQTEGPQDAGSLELIQRELHSTTFAVVSPQGRILSIWLDSSMHELPRNFIKGALAITQFVLPSPGERSASRWDTEEEDLNGHYLARYEETLNKQVDGQEPPARNLQRLFRKVKLHYVASANAKLRNSVYEVMPVISVDGSFTGRFNVQDGRLMSLEGLETQSFSVTDHKVGNTRTTLRFGFVRSEIIKPVELESLCLASVNRQMAQPGENLSTRRSSQITERALHRQTLGDATLDSLLTALETPPPYGESETQLYLKFRALVYLQPEVSDKVGQVLFTADADSRRATVLIGALGAIGHPEAQAALIRAIKARAGDQAMVQRLFLALAGCDEPSQPTEDALRELANKDNPSHLATIATQLLGSVARKVAGASPARAEKIIDALIADLTAATSPDSKKDALLALGATSSDRALSNIAPYLAAPEAEIRATAIVALRSYSTGPADDLLLNVLHFDPEPAVRLESALALGDRKMTPKCFSTQRKLFRAERDFYVRLAFLNNLWHARQDFPQAIRLIERVAKRDASKELQQTARTLLGGSI